MIICTRCGSRNADGDLFCGACSAFLEYEGERVGDAAPPAERPRLGQGEVACGSCGWGNHPRRKFCWRCGATLGRADAARIPWYRRLLRRRPALAAGERPAAVRRRLEGGPPAPVRLLRAARNVLLAGLLVAVAVAALLPPVRAVVVRRVAPAVTDLRRMVLPNDTHVHAIGATATSEVPGHRAAMAIDGFGNTYWAADLRAGAQPTLRIAFDQPVDLYDFLFTPGVPDAFQSEARPRDLHIVFSNGTSWDVTLADEAQPQRFTFIAKHVNRMEIQIRTVYPSSTGHAVVLKKVEFFTRT